MPTGVRVVSFNAIYSSTGETNLSNDDKVCPTILDAGIIKTTLKNGDSFIFDGLREYFSHAFTRLDSSELAHTRGPFRMGQERTGEYASPRSYPVYDMLATIYGVKDNATYSTMFRGRVEFTAFLMCAMLFD